MNLPLTSHRRSPARKVCSLRRSKGRLLDSLGYSLHLPDSAPAVFRKELKTSLHIAENTMSIQGLYRIEILTTNKWNCLFLKAGERERKKKKPCRHSSCLAACRAIHKEGKAIKQFCTSILPNAKCTPFGSAIWIRYGKSR